MLKTARYQRIAVQVIKVPCWHSEKQNMKVLADVGGTAHLLCAQWYKWTKEKLQDNFTSGYSDGAVPQERSEVIILVLSELDLTKRPAVGAGSYSSEGRANSVVGDGMYWGVCVILICVL